MIVMTLVKPAHTHRCVYARHSCIVVMTLSMVVTKLDKPEQIYRCVCKTFTHGRYDALQTAQIYRCVCKTFTHGRYDD